MAFLKLSLLALPIFLAIDALWLGFIAKAFYRTQIGGLMKTDVAWWAAGIFYLIFIAALVHFVIEPAIAKQSWTYALWGGALFGLVTYGTYDLTNQAVLKNWPVLVTVVDLAWGTFIATSVSVLTYFIAKNWTV